MSTDDFLFQETEWKQTVGDQIESSKVCARLIYGAKQFNSGLCDPLRWMKEALRSLDGRCARVKQDSHSW